MIIPELLAPVGSREALVAAVQNGADAVYLGGKMFSARQYASNFDREELCEALDYAHIRGVKVYITVNTLLSDTELPEALDYLKFLYEIGADAVIVQDLGLSGAAHELLPGLELHASTQMTVHNSDGVEVLKNHGFSRIVLARELSLKEIARIREKTGVELEVFVHGALCISYSGQCLMSSMIGGRSGNRGRCAQPCRMEYEIVDKTGRALAKPGEIGYHLLSPRDLNMIRHIPELAQAGVSSLKIEGRMKRPEYVAIVTRIYRDALDRFKEAPEDYMVSDKEIKELTQIFNRGFTTGYFFGKQGRDMMSFKRPNNRGLRLGRVIRVDRTKKMAEVLLEDTLHIGDGIEFWVTEGGRAGVVVSRIMVDGVSVNEAQPGQKAWVPAEGKIRPGDRVFKTHDAELISRAEQSFKSPREIKKIPVNFSVIARVGQPFAVTVSDPEGRRFSVRSDFFGQEAINKPLTYDNLAKQLDRLGNTPFALAALEADLDENVMVPASEINEARRRAIEGLEALRAERKMPAEPVSPEFSKKAEQLLNAGFRCLPSPGSVCEQKLTTVKGVKLTVRAGSLNMVRTAVAKGADIIYFGTSDLLRGDTEIKSELRDAFELCRETGAHLVTAMPRIVREFEMPRVRKLLESAASLNLPVLAGNLGVIREALAFEIRDIFADFPLNIFNSLTLRWLTEKLAIKQATVSPELTIGQIAAMAQKTDLPLEALVEGHLPLMVTEYCPRGSIFGGMTAEKGCSRPCRDRGAVGLKDRLDLVFPIAHDEFCRTHIYNAKELSMIEDIHPLFKAGISRFRIELSVENRDRAGAIVGFWRKELDRFMQDPARYVPDEGIKPKIEAMSPAGLTKGHYYRGVE